MTILYLLSFVIGTILLFIIVPLLRSMSRAFSRNPTEFKQGMVYDEKNDKVISTKTPVYTDPKTGLVFFGKCKKN
jgi:hypothetical protein